jgi:aspartyl-tRNA(Asn)/glutamyl-tRNA(Gln) amidotransferase subunit B
MPASLCTRISTHDRHRPQPRRHAASEIVSEPELRGAKEAVAHVKKMHEIVTSYGICDGNMQEGSADVMPMFPCASLATVLGTPQIKNLNSFRFMEQVTSL